MNDEAKKLKIKIVTPEKVILQDECERTIIPTVSGEICVLPEHQPLVSKIKSGEIRLIKDGHETLLAVSSGFIEVRPKSSLVILADTAERAENIDIKRAEEARKRAEDALKEKLNEEDVDYARIQAQLDKELARIKVGNRYRKLPQARQ